MRRTELPRARRATTGLALGVLLLGAAGCQELAVPNTNNPDRDRALAEASDVESLIASTWLPFWARVQGNDDPNHTLSAIADEFTTTAANFDAWKMSSEPRPAFDNNPTYTYSTFAENPYYGLYTGLSNVHDGLLALEKGIKIIDPNTKRDETARAKTFAKFTQGLLLGQLGLLFDRGFPVTENTEIYDPVKLAGMQPVSYTVMRDSAIASLRQAIALAKANTFTLPSTWIAGLALTNQDIVKLSQSYIARFIAYTPRSTTERAAANWQQVIASVDSGITADLAPIGGPGVLTSQYKRYSQVNPSPTQILFQADNKLLGPADVSGNYQQWLQTPLDQRQRFEITTPDRRITGAGGPKTNGTYFRYLENGNMRVDRGTYHHSLYQFYRFKGAYGQTANTPLLSMTRAEMDLLKAEALIRLNRSAEAVALINKTRVANGQLPPVTAAGVPAGADCAPRKDSGACGDLMDALQHEKRIETVGTDQIAFYDARGWGRLVKGSILHLPIPGRELAVLKIAMYTTGGGSEGSAP